MELYWHLTLTGWGVLLRTQCDNIPFILMFGINYVTRYWTTGQVFVASMHFINKCRGFLVVWRLNLTPKIPSRFFYLRETFRQALLALRKEWVTDIRMQGRPATAAERDRRYVPRSRWIQNAWINIYYGALSCKKPTQSSCKPKQTDNMG